MRLPAVIVAGFLMASPALAADETMADGSPAWEFFALCSAAAFHESQWLATNRHPIDERKKAIRVSADMIKQARERLARDRGISARDAILVTSDFVRRNAGALDDADRDKTGLARPSWIRFIACEAAHGDVAAGETTWEAFVSANGALPPLQR